MATYTIDQIGITRTSANIDDNDVFELQIKDGGADDEKSAKITFEELRDAVNGGVTPLIYKALLTQTGTNAPVATVLQNTLGGTVVWSYGGVGDYLATLAGAFPQNKTLIISGATVNIPFGGNTNATAYLFWDSVNTIGLYSQDGTGVATNNILNYTSILIEVYP